jgi:glycosyltransferase involved in cell wall biosynthesis
VRILVVSNFYPPHVLGGYELGCRDVVDALRARGHAVSVLTSAHGVARPVADGHVFRWLRTEPLDSREFNGGARRRDLIRLQVRNQRAFDRLASAVRPDVVYVWNLARLPITLALRAESRGPVSYYVSDQWLARWSEPGWYGDAWYRAVSAPAHRRSRLGAAALRAAFGVARLTWPSDDLRLHDVQFCSAFLRDLTMRAGRTPRHCDVVHWGVDGSRFAPAHRPNTRRRTRLLYVGQLLPHKGVHTAIDAVRQLHRGGDRDITLTIAGAPHQPEYAARLRHEAAASGTGDAIRFVGPQPRERLPEIYREHDVLVFPSCWDEPFAITPLEAMAAGLAVVGTLAGGSREIFEDGVNALTFAQEDAAGCAAQIARLARDAALAEAVARRGRETVLDRFTLSGMVDRIEARLELAARRHGHEG